MNAAEVLKTCREERVRFIRLQFTDILGCNKNVEIPQSQFEKALDGQILFDGSSIEGFSRIEESDTLLHPDPDTFRIFPWEQLERGKVARLICDVCRPDGSPFQGCPRTRLKEVIAQARRNGYSMQAGPELEFFLFQINQKGEPSTVTHDSGGYFDLTPVDRGEEARRDIVNTLEAMGFEVEAAHHEVSPGQHEIDFRHDEALKTADNIVTYRLIVRKVAQDHGLHATFMPKPIRRVNGSGMHIHQSLLREGRNAFSDPATESGISQIALHYIAGLLAHAPALCAVTNPLVNSYKRLVRGFEAPTAVAWSERNRSPLIRIPARRGQGTRCELRMPDPSCNPYLALAAILKAGLDGIENALEPPPPVQKNIFRMSVRERRKHRIADLPRNLNEALKRLQRDRLVQDALGPHIYKRFLEAKKLEWRTYSQHVHPWEIEEYLRTY